MRYLGRFSRGGGLEIVALECVAGVARLGLNRGVEMVVGRSNVLLCRALVCYPDLKRTNKIKLKK